MNRRNQEVVVSIGIAAQVSGVHAQTLRQYERQGLIAPLRTPGGARRYRERDLMRVRRIVDLTEQGLSLAAVRYVLGLEDEVAELRGRVAELEDALGQARPRRTYSLELVHVPQPRRGTRWTNADW